MWNLFDIHSAFSRIPMGMAVRWFFAGHQGNQPEKFTKDLTVKVQRWESFVRFDWLSGWIKNIRSSPKWWFFTVIYHGKIK